MEESKIEQVHVRGASIPKLGFGTWELEGAACKEAVGDALRIGYRHIDTAQVYDNEAEVGEAISASSVSRDDVWLTTKIWRDNFAPADMKKSTRASLDRLKTDYVDLLLIHWPPQETDLAQMLETLSELQQTGLTRHIGVSNFPSALLWKAVEQHNIVCNQVECHPYLQQHKVLETAQSREIALTAYSPLARGNVMDDETLQGIGKSHGKSPAQIAIRWQLERPGVVTIPKASSKEHAQSNWDARQFSLTSEDQRRIGRLDKGLRLIDPEWAPKWDN